MLEGTKRKRFERMTQNKTITCFICGNDFNELTDHYFVVSIINSKKTICCNSDEYFKLSTKLNPKLVSSVKEIQIRLNLNLTQLSIVKLGLSKVPHTWETLPFKNALDDIVYQIKTFEDDLINNWSVKNEQNK